jgi:hypothetical protein
MRCGTICDKPHLSIRQHLSDKHDDPSTIAPPISAATERENSPVETSQMNIFRLALLGSLSLVAACAPRTYQSSYSSPSYSSPSYSPKVEPKVIAIAQAGQRPADYKKPVDLYIAGLLKDPESRKVVYTGNPYGGLVCGTINAKNSYGGYTGAEPFYAVFDSNKKISELIMLSASDANLFRRSNNIDDPGYEYYKLLTDCGAY